MTRYSITITVMLLASLAGNAYLWHASRAPAPPPQAVEMLAEAHEREALDLDEQQSVDLALLQAHEAGAVKSARAAVTEHRRRASTRRAVAVTQAAASDPAMQRAVAEAIGVDPNDVSAIGDTVSLTRAAALRLVDATQAARDAVAEERALCGVTTAELHQALVVEALAHDQERDREVLALRQEADRLRLQVQAAQAAAADARRGVITWGVVAGIVGLVVGAGATTGVVLAATR